MWVCWRCHHSPGCQSTVNQEVAKFEFGPRSEGLNGLSPKTLFTQNRVLETLTPLPVGWSQCPPNGLWEMVSLISPTMVLRLGAQGLRYRTQRNHPRIRFSWHQKKKDGKCAMAVPSIWLTHHSEWVGTGVVPHTYSESNHLPYLAFARGAPKGQNTAKIGGLSVCTPATPLLSGRMTCPSKSGQGTSPGRCPVKMTETA